MNHTVVRPNYITYDGAYLLFFFFLYADAIKLVSFQLWYVLSKTLAEEAAWKFAKENSIDLVTINPGFVSGPLLQPTLNGTVEMILNLVNGIFFFFLHHLGLLFDACSI